MKIGTIHGLDVIIREFCGFEEAIRWVAYGCEPLDDSSFFPPVRYDIDVDKEEYAKNFIIAALRQNKFKKIFIFPEKKDDLPERYRCILKDKDYFKVWGRKTLFLRLRSTGLVDVGLLFHDKRIQLKKTELYFTYAELSSISKHKGRIREYVEQHQNEDATGIVEANIGPKETAEEYKKRLDLDNRPMLKICLELAERRTAAEYTEKKDSLVEDIVKEFKFETKEPAKRLASFIRSPESEKGGRKPMKPKK